MMDVQLADGVTVVRIDHPPVNAFTLDLIGLSEVAVGVPFPVAALEICRYAMGPSVRPPMRR